MHIIGLVGGIASGKSAVAAALERRGAVAFDADRVGHQVLAEPDVVALLVERWGAGILDAAGRVDRPAVARIVFAETPAGAAERQFLEETLHPRIRQLILAEIARLPDLATPAVVIDAPLLLESGWDQICQAVVFVDAPREQRLQRALARGWTRDEFSRREAAQMPIDEKRARATHVIANSGSLAELDAEVARFWSDAVAAPASPRKK